MGYLSNKQNVDVLNQKTDVGHLPQNLHLLNSAYGSEHLLKTLLHKMQQHKVRAMSDIVINHRVGTTKGHGGVYNRYDGIPLSWDEHSVTSCTGGLVYAYILTHPGTPRVFYNHFYDWGTSIHDQIVKLIDIRKKQDIHSRSSIRILEAQSNLYAATIGEKVSMKIGDDSWSPQGKGKMDGCNLKLNRPRSRRDPASPC